MMGAASAIAFLPDTEHLPNPAHSRNPVVILLAAPADHSGGTVADFHGLPISRAS